MRGDGGLLCTPKSQCSCALQILITSQRTLQGQSKKEVVAPKSLQLKWKHSAERVEAGKTNGKVSVISSSRCNALFFV